MKALPRLCATAAAVLAFATAGPSPIHAFGRTGAGPVAQLPPDSLSGHILGRNGQPLSGAQVQATVGAASNSAVTDAQGYYFLAIASGPVYLQVFGRGPAGVAPSDFYVERYDVVVSGPTTFDLTLPVAQVSGVVRNPDTSPAAGALLALSTYNFATGGRTVSRASIVTASDGTYTTLLLTGSASVTITPAVATVVPVVANFTIGADVVENFAFGAAVSVTGTIRGRNNLPVAGATVMITVGASAGAVLTNASGQYAMTLGNGPAYVQVFGDGPAGTAPASFYVERFDAVVNGPTVIDATLPVVALTGVVRAPDTTPVPGASIEYSTTDFQAGGRTRSNAVVTTDVNGAYSTLVLAGTVEARATPPAGSALAPLSRVFTARGDSAQDFALAPLTSLAGTVRGRSLLPVANAIVRVTVNGEVTVGQTDEYGRYSLLVPGGTALVEMSGPGGAGGPGSFVFSRTGVVIAGATTFDVTLDVAQVGGVVTDANGVAIPNVAVATSTSARQPSGQTSSSSTATSAADGSFAALVLTGSATVQILPPALSGFAAGTAAFTVSGDVRRPVTVQHVDVRPPAVVEGPVVLHRSATSASIGWKTNRASTSVVEYGPGSLALSQRDAALTTTHLVTLTGLTPGAPYDFRAGSADASGNGPAFSLPGRFVTLAAPGDVSAPVILAGPVAVFADQASVLVEWTTDEPASSLVDLAGPPATSVDGDPGRFAQVHRVLLTGLAADTTYSASVRSKDPDDNEVSSNPFSFRTAAVPDTFAPTIAGPVAIATTDTRIVLAWTTNEPATSGVSFNDGTAFDLAGDPAPVRAHQMTIAGLSPATLYHVTASAVDPDGNGPSLSAVLDVTTAAARDTVAPAITGVGTSAVTTNSAVVGWTTDKFATESVSFGPTSGMPVNSAADLAFDTAHALTLTGLQPGTTYYFTVTSVDAAGNTATSVEFSFETRPLVVDLPPTPPSPVAGPSSPTNAAVIRLTWGASTDDRAVTGYQVLRDGVVIATVDPAATAYDDATAVEGSHDYRIGAMDAAGHVTLSVVVTIVIDRTPPVLKLPQDISAPAVGRTAVVTFDASATDNLDPSVAVTCAPPSGTAFPVGVTTVTCSASDTAGNAASGRFTVTVHDVTPPDLTVPFDLTPSATSAAGAVVTFTATATDLVDGPVTPVCAPPSGATFPLGTTVVSCTATDAAGNAVTRTFRITVIDTTPPVISRFAPSLAVLWPPNHRMVPLAIRVTVTDDTDPSPVCRITGITSSEPVTGVGDTTAPDWTFSGLSFSLRAERTGAGNGRVYTITGECRDAAGNVAAASTTVRVPKSASQ